MFDSIFRASKLITCHVPSHLKSYLKATVYAVNSRAQGLCMFCLDCCYPLSGLHLLKTWEEMASYTDTKKHNHTCSGFIQKM